MTKSQTLEDRDRKIEQANRDLKVSHNMAVARIEEFYDMVSRVLGKARQEELDKATRDYNESVRTLMTTYGAKAVAKVMEGE